MEKLYFKPSAAHGNMTRGASVVLLKDHNEVSGRITAGTKCIVTDIIHFPTRYKIKDISGQIWTVPSHAVQRTEEDVTSKNVLEGEKQPVKKSNS